MNKCKSTYSIFPLCAHKSGQMKEEFLRLLEESNSFSSSQSAVLSQLPVNNELQELICNSEEEALLELIGEIVDDPEGNIKGVINAIIQARKDEQFIHILFHNLLETLTSDKLNEDRSLQVIQIIQTKVSKKKKEN